MKRLFAVRNRNTRKMAELDGGVKYFPNKQEAKDFRLLFNGKDDEGNENLAGGWVVVLGPDHDRYQA